MKAEKYETLESLPWYRKLILIAFFPFMLIGMILLALLFPLLLIVISGVNFAIERRFLYQLRQSGRYLRLSSARARISEEGGTFIIEKPTLGWNFTHAWWTPDDLLALSPYPVPTEDEYDNSAKEMKCLNWDAWCWDNYTSPETGRAFLIRVWNGMSLEPRLTKRFPNTRIVRTWTALANLPDPQESSNTIDAT